MSVAHSGDEMKRRYSIRPRLDHPPELEQEL